MSEYEIASLTMGGIVGAAQIAVVIWGILTMKRSTMDRANEHDQRHQQAMAAQDQRHQQAMVGLVAQSAALEATAHGIEALIQRTGKGDPTQSN